jgi:hypothetical protein
MKRFIQGEHRGQSTLLGKTQRPVQLVFNEQTRAALEAWIHQAQLRRELLVPKPAKCLRSSFLQAIRWHRQSLRNSDAPAGAQSARRHRSQPGYIRNPYAAAKGGAADQPQQDEELKTVQLLLGHTKPESTVRYLGIEVDSAFEMAEQTKVNKSDGSNQTVAIGQSRTSRDASVRWLPGMIVRSIGTQQIQTVSDVAQAFLGKDPGDIISFLDCPIAVTGVASEHRATK